MYGLDGTLYEFAVRLGVGRVGARAPADMAWPISMHRGAQVQFPSNTTKSRACPHETCPHRRHRKRHRRPGPHETRCLARVPGTTRDNERVRQARPTRPHTMYNRDSSWHSLTSQDAAAMRCANALPWSHRIHLATADSKRRQAAAESSTEPCLHTPRVHVCRWQPGHRPRVARAGACSRQALDPFSLL